MRGNAMRDGLAMSGWGKGSTCPSPHRTHTFMAGARKAFAPATLCLALCLGGCGHKAQRADDAASPSAAVPAKPAPKSDIPAPSPAIDKVNIQSLVTVVNLDDKPGPDGVQVKLYLFHRDDPTPITLDRGLVEFVIYDGHVPPSDLAAAKPLHVWPFTADQLRRYAAKTAFGPAYAMSLNWGDDHPRASTVTLTARILHPTARPLYAPPINLAMGAK